MLRLYLRRMGVGLVNALFNHRCVFSALGALNRRLRFLSTLFVCYPADQSIALSYIHDSRLAAVASTLSITGVYFQNGKIGLTMTFWMTERELLRAYATDRFKELLAEANEIGRYLHVEVVRFAGILPGILTSKKLLNCSGQNQEVASIIGRTIEQIKVLENLAEPVPVIVLGGNGFTGKVLTAWLRARRAFIYSVDRSYLKNDEATCNYVSLGELPSSLKRQKSILIDVSCRGALAKAESDLWGEFILLNDVYPEPTPEELGVFARIGIPVYHIIGVQAKAFPAFPNAYRGGIPCCAAYQSEGSEILVQRL